MDLLELAKVSVCRRVESINPSVRGSKDLISHILRELHPAAPDTRSSWLLTLRGPPTPISQVLFDQGMIWLWFTVLSYLFPTSTPALWLKASLRRYQRNAENPEVRRRFFEPNYGNIRHVFGLQRMAGGISNARVKTNIGLPLFGWEPFRFKYSEARLSFKCLLDPWLHRRHGYNRPSESRIYIVFTESLWYEWQ